MGKIQVNPSTGKVIVFRDSSGDSKLCSTCCIPKVFADNDLLCFLEPSESPPACHSDDWDQYPPFGGPGKSPQFYTIALDGVAACPSPPYTPVQNINGVWHLENQNCGGTFNGCFTLTTTVGGRTTTFAIDLCLSTGAQYRMSVTDGSGGGVTLYQRFFAGVGGLGQCPIAADNEANQIQGCFPPGSIPAFGGTASWRPGTCLQWDSSTNYFSGDCAAHEGVFYECILAHINQEPPNGLYWTVI